MKLDGLLQATSLATPNGALRFCYQCGAKLVAACRDGGIIKKVFPKFCTECGEAQTNEAPPSVAQTMSLSREAVFDGVMAPTTGSPAAQEHPAPVGSSTDADELHPPDQLTARLLEGVKIVSDVYRRAQVETEAAARTGGQALAIELAQLEAQKEALEVRRTRIRTHTRARNSCALTLLLALTIPSPASFQVRNATLETRVAQLQAALKAQVTAAWATVTAVAETGTELAAVAKLAGDSVVAPVASRAPSRAPVQATAASQAAAAAESPQGSAADDAGAESPSTAAATSMAAAASPPAIDAATVAAAAAAASVAPAIERAACVEMRLTEALEQSRRLRSLVEATMEVETAVEAAEAEAAEEAALEERRQEYRRLHRLDRLHRLGQAVEAEEEVVVREEVGGEEEARGEENDDDEEEQVVVEEAEVVEVEAEHADEVKEVEMAAVGSRWATVQTLCVFEVEEMVVAVEGMVPAPEVEAAAEVARSGVEDMQSDAQGYEEAVEPASSAQQGEWQSLRKDEVTAEAEAEGQAVEAAAGMPEEGSAALLNSLLPRSQPQPTEAGPAAPRTLGKIYQKPKPSAMGRSPSSSQSAQHGATDGVGRSPSSSAAPIHASPAAHQPSPPPNAWGSQNSVEQVWDHALHNDKFAQLAHRRHQEEEQAEERAEQQAESAAPPAAEALPKPKSSPRSTISLTPTTSSSAATTSKIRPSPAHIPELGPDKSNLRLRRVMS